jgi:hypothetical protein
MFTHKSFIRGMSAGWSHYQGPFPHQLPDGRVILLVAAYKEQETFLDNAVYYCISADRGETWSAPEIFMAAPNANVSHVTMVNLKGTQKVLLFWRETFFKGASDDSKTVSGIKDYARSLARVFVRTSEDSGRTWSAPRQIDMLGEVSAGRFFYGGPQVPQQLQSGRIIFPFGYLRDDGYAHNASFMVSDDEGKTWMKGYDIVIPVKRGAMEPTPVELKPNQLYCLFRTKSGFLWESTSSDGALTWTEPKQTDIPSPESIPHLLKLASGNYLLVWNSQSSVENYPRWPMTAALSTDGCKTWAFKRDIATETGRNQISNHGITQLDDGRILLALSHYHALKPTSSDIETVLFDEDWVKGG